MKITLVKVAVVALPLAMFSCGGNSGEGTKALDNANMDLSVKPGDDFFQYAGGTWLKNTPIPDDKTSYGELALSALAAASSRIDLTSAMLFS